MARRWSNSVRDPWQNSENLLECGADIADGQRNGQSCKIEHGVVTVDVLEPTAVDTVKDSEFDLVLYTCTYGGENRVAVFCDRIVR